MLFCICSINIILNRIIWAFHASTDPEKECFDSNTILEHTNKGAQSLNLNSGIQTPVELESDIEYIDIVMDNVAVPSNHTTYYCKLFKIPEFTSTHHVVKFSPIVTEGNEGRVHHLIAYECAEWLITNENYIGAEGVCDTDFENMPVVNCRGTRITYAWAIGGEEFYMPENVGLPIGGDSTAKYIFMEMHYDVCIYSICFYNYVNLCQLIYKELLYIYI